MPYIKSPIISLTCKKLYKHHIFLLAEARITQSLNHCPHWPDGTFPKPTLSKNKATSSPLRPSLLHVDGLTHKLHCLIISCCRWKAAGNNWEANGYHGIPSYTHLTFTNSNYCPGIFTGETSEREVGTSIHGGCAYCSQGRLLRSEPETGRPLHLESRKPV